MYARIVGADTPALDKRIQSITIDLVIHGAMFIDALNQVGEVLPSFLVC
jgi:hypothetical protein